MGGVGQGIGEGPGLLLLLSLSVYRQMVVVVVLFIPYPNISHRLFLQERGGRQAVVLSRHKITPNLKHSATGRNYTTTVLKFRTDQKPNAAGCY